MRINHAVLVVFSCLLPMLAICAQASPSIQKGRVNMKGSIIDTACAIAVENREQVIDMGGTSLGNIARDGQGNARHFAIELVSCVLVHPGNSDWKQFQVTFDGNAEGPLFSVQGGASGVGLQITDIFGNVAIPGKPLPLNGFEPGKRQLNYILKVMSNQQVLKVGHYFTVIRFKMEYF